MDQVESPHREYVDYTFYRRMKDSVYSPIFLPGNLTA